MLLQKSRLVLLAVFCASALIAAVSPARARSYESELPQQSTKNVTALNALDSFDSPPIAAVAANVENATANKPEAPAPKIATDTEAAQQSNSTASGTPSQQNPSGPPSNPTGQQDDNPKRILGFIPNFQTKNDDPGNQQPLTVKQKYILELHQTVDFSAHIGNAVSGRTATSLELAAALWRGLGPVCGTVWRRGSRSGDFLHFLCTDFCRAFCTMTLATSVAQRPVDPISNLLFRNSNGHNAQRQWRTDI